MFKILVQFLQNPADSIQKRIWLGFSSLLVILSIVLIVMLLNYKSFYTSFDVINNKIEPIYNSSIELSRKINTAQASLGLYLISKEIRYKKEYLKNLETAKKISDELKLYIYSGDDESMTLVMNKISKDIAKLIHNINILLTFAEDDIKNYPAISYSSQSIVPITRQSLEAMTLMVESLNEYADNNFLAEANQEYSVEKHANFLKVFRITQELRYIWRSMTYFMSNYILLGKDNPDYKNYIYVFRDQVLKIIGQYDEIDLLGFIELEEQLPIIKNQLSDYVKHMDKIISLHESEKWRMDAYIVKNDIGPIFLKLTANLNQLITIQKQRKNTASTDMLQTMDNTKIVILIITLGGGLLALLAASYIGAWVARRLNAIVTTMNDVAQSTGNLTHHLDEAGADEISFIGRCFNRFIDKIRNVVNLVLETSNGLVGETSKASEISNTTSQGILEQQIAIEKVVVSMNEITETVNGVAESASAAAETAKDTRLSANNGKQVIETSVNEIMLLSENINSLSATIVTLEQQCENIGKVVTVINNIAEQTNLLALNAAIEAARAGEQGRGFAVVADEVRTLSQRTNEQTSEIQQIIQQLQEGARHAVEQITQSVSMTEHGVEQVKLAGETLDTIAQSVTTITELNQKIADSTQQQALTTQAINKNMTTINGIAVNTVNSAQEMSNTITNLNMMSVQMQGMVNQFLYNKAMEQPANDDESTNGDVDLF